MLEDYRDNTNTCTGKNTRFPVWELQRNSLITNPNLGLSWVFVFPELGIYHMVMILILNLGSTRFPSWELN